MPYDVTQDTTACPVGKPWAVKKSATGEVMGCHPTEAEAKSQQAALYANEPAAGTNSADSGGESFRSVPFEVRASGDGQTLEGYAAVFDTPTMIRDWQGDFEETIARGAFARALAEATPVLMFEHGQHPLIGSMPLGVIRSAQEDSRGLHIVASLTDNWLIQPVRDAVRDGGINGMSFRFSVPDGGDTWTRRKGAPDQRTVREAYPLPELGPVVFPAYEPTTASVRSLLDRLPTDFTGRPGARSAGGGDRGSGPGNGSAPTQSARARDRALRLEGILK